MKQGNFLLFVLSFFAGAFGRFIDYPLSVNFGPEIGDFFRSKNPAPPESLSQAGKKSRPEFDSKRNFAIPIADLQNYESKKVLNAFSRLQDNPFFMDWLSNRDLRINPNETKYKLGKLLTSRI
ncbi:Oidioi.mRNA.OKI2018_I69.chr1.g1376.t1.cds [Oikopleura dioica]|uniref:Oidioi.mRNA.OKI2018_I69.chr1.g1376.t1.cds n=1 Tax=Oikopleura dioica TaxID=34765 RepID=A0ABN7SSR1_OIKDI|nr:Oidioi.mRNA.OKI2018_I69.chr1.g1376.t1.cds [Oikopleura dioica]